LVGFGEGAEGVYGEIRFFGGRIHGTEIIGAAFEEGGVGSGAAQGADKCFDSSDDGAAALFFEADELFEGLLGFTEGGELGGGEEGEALELMYAAFVLPGSEGGSEGLDLAAELAEFLHDFAFAIAVGRDGGAQHAELGREILSKGTDFGALGEALIRLGAVELGKALGFGGEDVEIAADFEGELGEGFAGGGFRFGSRAGDDEIGSGGIIEDDTIVAHQAGEVIVIFDHGAEDIFFVEAEAGLAIDPVQAGFACVWGRSRHCGGEALDGFIPALEMHEDAAINQIVFGVFAVLSRAGDEEFLGIIEVAVLEFDFGSVEVAFHEALGINESIGGLELEVGLIMFQRLEEFLVFVGGISEAEMALAQVIFKGEGEAGSFFDGEAEISEGGAVAFVVELLACGGEIGLGAAGLLQGQEGAFIFFEDVRAGVAASEEINEGEDARGVVFGLEGEDFVNEAGGFALFDHAAGFVEQVVNAGGGGGFAVAVFDGQVEVVGGFEIARRFMGACIGDEFCGGLFQLLGDVHFALGDAVFEGCNGDGFGIALADVLQDSEGLFRQVAGEEGLGVFNGDARALLGEFGNVLIGESGTGAAGELAQNGTQQFDGLVMEILAAHVAGELDKFTGFELHKEGIGGLFEGSEALCGGSGREETADGFDNTLTAGDFAFIEGGFSDLGEITGDFLGGGDKEGQACILISHGGGRAIEGRAFDVCRIKHAALVNPERAPAIKAIAPWRGGADKGLFVSALHGEVVAGIQRMRGEVMSKAVIAGLLELGEVNEFADAVVVRVKEFGVFDIELRQGDGTHHVFGMFFIPTDADFSEVTPGERGGGRGDADDPDEGNGDSPPRGAAVGAAEAEAARAQEGGHAKDSAGEPADAEEQGAAQRADEGDAREDGAADGVGAAGEGAAAALRAETHAIGERGAAIGTETRGEGGRFGQGSLDDGRDAQDTGILTFECDDEHVNGAQADARAETEGSGTHQLVINIEIATAGEIGDVPAVDTAFEAGVIVGEGLAVNDQAVAFGAADGDSGVNFGGALVVGIGEEDEAHSVSYGQRGVKANRRGRRANSPSRAAGCPVRRWGGP